jgi:hypothetical protein
MGMISGLIASLVVSVASSAVSYAQQKSAAKDAKRQANIQAAAAQKQLDYDTWVHDQESAQLLASQRAAFAAMGMDLGEEDATPLTVLSQTSANRAVERQYLREGGALSVQAYREKAASYDDVAAMSLVSGGLKVAGAAASAYTQYDTAKREGRIE